jgi:beta-glucosidase
MQQPPKVVADQDDTSVQRASIDVVHSDSTTRGASLRVRDAIRQLPLADKVRLLTGSTPWALHSLPELALDSIVLSDGPIGVRGVDEENTPSAQLPSPSAIAATWDLDLTSRLGTLVAREARRKHTDVVLAPVVNLQRTPVGGRHFECYSEDPLLTGAIASAYVAAAQAEGVGMCVKHFIGNESETERTSYLATIDERTLREVYLAPFEKVVVEAGVWSVMAAYNGVDDGTEAAPATEHQHLVNKVLKGEWGFDGVLVSDWLAATSTVPSALGGLDLVMPGPGGPWEDALLAAVNAGLVPEFVIDDKVERIVRLGERVGAVGRTPSAIPGIGTVPEGIPAQLYSTTETRLLLREAVARSIVVLRNDNQTLPLQSTGVQTIALIGPNAVEPFVQGGGSAFVHAPYSSDPESALREAFPDANIVVARGGSGRRQAQRVAAGLVTAPDGSAGYLLQLFDSQGTALGNPTLVEATESWNRHVPIEAVSALVSARVWLSAGKHRLEVGTSGRHSIRFDSETVSTSAVLAGSNVILDSSANHPDGPSVHYVIPEGCECNVQIEAQLQVVNADGYGTFVRFELRHEPEDVDADGEIETAVAAARAADVAIVIVGTNEETESEGWDRPSLDLPARQNEIVRRVIDANPRTIVVVNAGAPVILPWLEEASAVLWWWLPGQEAGHGLVDALVGRTEPSGRLPWTLPAAFADAPVQNGLPLNGVIHYSEGVHVGHRGWDRLGRTPARPFGYGEGYTRWDYEALEMLGWQTAQELVVTVELTNAGERAGRETVQLYLEDRLNCVDRPLRWLAGFSPITLEAGATGRVEIRIPRRSFETWDVESHKWIFASGDYVIRAGHSSRDLPLHVIVDVTSVVDLGTPHEK